MLKQRVFYIVYSSLSLPAIRLLFPKLLIFSAITMFVDHPWIQVKILSLNYIKQNGLKDDVSRWRRLSHMSMTLSFSFSRLWRRSCASSDF